MELLAGAQAGEDDLDRALGPGREQAGHVDDAHGLAHVEHEGLAAAADGAGLDDQLHRLLDGHEVAGDVGVGDGDRAAALDLGVERGEHRAPAAEHVAEADARGTCRWPRRRRGR